MSSNDKSAPSPEFGASSSRDRAPVTPNASESDDDGDDSARKKARKYKRPRVKWDSVVSIAKGAEGEMDDDERKAQILQGARAFMEAGKIYKLPGHKSCAMDFGLWKLAKEWPVDGGATMVPVFKCPLASRFRCNAEIKVTDSTSYINVRNARRAR